MKRRINCAEELHAFGCYVQKLNIIGRSFEFETPVHVLSAIHGDCVIGAYSFIGGGGRFRNVTIGRFCSIAPDVVIGQSEHPTTWLSTHPFQYLKSDRFDFYDGHVRTPMPRNWPSQQTTVIGNDVWIGNSVVVKQGLRIGDGAVIGAGSVVTKDVEPYSIVGGVPARHIRYRFERGVIDRLIDICWWNFSVNTYDVDYSDVDEVLRAIELNLIPPLVTQKFRFFDGNITEIRTD